MLRLPRFEVRTPASVDEVVAALQLPGARILAGGTDLLPNLKHRLDAPTTLVSLARLTALRSIIREDDGVRVGASVTLTELASDSNVQSVFPSLADAAGRIASPLIRNSGTVGGNINLDTRCRYVNQTAFWRSAIGGCLKSEGDVCHVVPGGRNCVAAMSSDLVPVLISLDATVVLVGAQGRREVPVEGYFKADGTRHTIREDDELLTEVRIPNPSMPRRTRYIKWTVRQSIDFPLLSIALRFDLAAPSDTASDVVQGVKVVVGVLGSRPRVVSRLEGVLGRSLREEAVADEIAERVFAQCKPLENVPYEADYRRQMLRVHTRRAVRAMAGA